LQAIYPFIRFCQFTSAFLGMGQFPSARACECCCTRGRAHSATCAAFVFHRNSFWQSALSNVKFDMSATKIISEIKKLPSAQQKKVFRFLEKLRDAQIKKAWDKEIARRLEEIDSGKVKPIPAEKVFAKLRAKYG
jgi:putative addiction module component (TIGR02574 family)